MKRILFILGLWISFCLCQTYTVSLQSDASGHDDLIFGYFVWSASSYSAVDDFVTSWGNTRQFSFPSGTQATFVGYSCASGDYWFSDWQAINSDISLSYHSQLNTQVTGGQTPSC